MPFILKQKKPSNIDCSVLYLSLPKHWFDEKQEKICFITSQKKEIQFENNEFLIVKVVLERGGSNYDNVENACKCCDYENGFSA
jgi:hypothetical protein